MWLILIYLANVAFPTLGSTLPEECFQLSKQVIESHFINHFLFSLLKEGESYIQFTSSWLSLSPSVSLLNSTTFSISVPPVNIKLKCLAHSKLVCLAHSKLECLR